MYLLGLVCCRFGHFTFRDLKHTASSARAAATSICAPATAEVDCLVPQPKVVNFTVVRQSGRHQPRPNLPRP